MITFKYKEEPISSKDKKIKRPVADIDLKSSSGLWIRYHPYIDSGADITIIPLSLGKLLGLKDEKRKIQYIGGISGSVPVIYLNIQMRVAEEKFISLIAWAQIEEVPALLGRTNVFDMFKITFVQYKGIIVFEKR